MVENVTGLRRMRSSAVSMHLQRHLAATFLNHFAKLPSARVRYSLVDEDNDSLVPLEDARLDVALSSKASDENRLEFVVGQGFELSLEH